MSGHRRLRRLILLAQVLAIASATSAVSLQDFQLITIIQVPSLSCLAAYGRPISGCSRSDFRDGVQCSQSCAMGIQQDQANIVAACRNVEVNERSLLGLALRGGLLDALCPDFQATSVTSIVTPTTTRTFLTPSQTRTTLTPTETATESSPTITLSTPDSSETSTTTRGSPTQTDTTSVNTTPTETEGTTTIPSTTVPPTESSSTSNPSPPQTSDDPGDQIGRGSSGGGSPFDPVFIGGTGRLIPTHSNVLATLIGTLVAMLLMG